MLDVDVVVSVDVVDVDVVVLVDVVDVDVVVSVDFVDVNRSIYHGGNFADKWLWLLPLLLIMYVGVVFVLRRIFRHWLDHESSVIGLINSNLAILLKKVMWVM